MFEPRYLVEPPTILQQTDWTCGFYNLPETNPPSVHFNCGLVHAGEHFQDWLVTRKQVFRGLSRISFWALHGSQVGVEHSTVITPRHADEHAEDPRCFVFDGHVFMSWTAWRNMPPGNRAHQCFGEVKDGFIVNQVVHLAFGKNRNRGYEKNWVWFMNAAGLHMIYSMNPHIVVRVTDGKAAETITTTTALPWTYGEARGGSPPVLVGNEYFCFFHSSVPWLHPYRRYFMGAYAFASNPPFNIVGITPHPLLYGSLADPRVNNQGPIVVFPCGARLLDGIWKVTLGVNDCRSAWIDIPHGELLGKMTAT